MINSIPIVGWLISIVVSVSLAIPFWFCWSFCGLGETYFYWLPAVYQILPFWHVVGLFIVLSILKGKFPTFVSSSATNNAKQDVK